MLDAWSKWCARRFPTSAFAWQKLTLLLPKFNLLRRLKFSCRDWKLISPSQTSLLQFPWFLRIFQSFFTEVCVPDPRNSSIIWRFCFLFNFAIKSTSHFHVVVITASQMKWKWAPSSLSLSLSLQTRSSLSSCSSSRFCFRDFFILFLLHERNSKRLCACKGWSKRKSERERERFVTMDNGAIIYNRDPPVEIPQSNE